MKKIYNSIFICFFLLTISISNKSFATTYTWTGGSGIWDNTNKANWLPQGVPSPYDTVLFNGSSFTTASEIVTIKNGTTCGTLIMNGIKNNPEFLLAASDSLFINNSFSLDKNCKWNVNGIITLSKNTSDTTKINTDGLTINALTLQGSPIIFESNLNVSNTLTLKTCSLYVNNFNITCKMFEAPIYSANIYLFGSAQIHTIDSWNGVNTNVYTDQRARLIFGIYAKPFTFNTNYCNFEVYYQNNSSSGALEFRGLCTFNGSNYSLGNLVLTPGSKIMLPSQSTQFYKHIVAKGTVNDSVYIESTSPGMQANLSSVSFANTCLYYVSVTDVNCSSGTIGLNNSKIKTSGLFGWDTTANCKPIQATFTETSKILCNGNQGGGYISIVQGTGTGSTPVYLWSDPSISIYTSSTTNLAAGTYTVNVSDYGDTAKVVFTLSEPAPFKVKITPKDIACYGDSTGLAVISITGGTSPYTPNTFSWNLPQGSLISANKDTISKITPYTVYVEFKDSNNCYASVSYRFQQPNNPLSTTLTTNNASCYSACDGAVFATVTGGWAPYTYSWSNKETTNKVSGLCGDQTYILLTKDSLGCSISDTATVLNVGTPAQLSGTILHLSNPVDGAVVSLLQYDSASHMTFIKNHITQNGGMYLFDSVPVGEIVLRVTPPLGGLYVNDLPSYYTSNANPAYLWDSASHFTVQCYDVLTNYDINFYTITPETGGLGKISGKIKEGEGFVSARVLAPGAGIPGVNVGLKKKPGGQVVASTFSDTTQFNEGYYEFNNLPDGDYEIYADIPGLPQETTYDVTINGDTYNNLDFLADSAHINAEYGVGIAKSNKTISNGLKLYPNPFNSITTLEITTSKSELASIDIYNLIGVKCASLYSGMLTSTTNLISLNPEKLGLKQGIYLLKYTTNSETKTLKINYTK